jgi:C4-dicarboxylate transporter DctQ subunit
VVKLTATVICVAYALLMLYGSSVFVSSLYTLGNLARDVPAPKWLLTMTMPLGFVLLTWRFLEVGWQVLREIVKGASNAQQQQT